MNDKSIFLDTERGKTKSNATEIPSISLPKGGGSIKGIDEKFSVNAINGTSSFSIPLPSSEARSLSPSLNLSYNSGTGNGVFGLGWSLESESIKRKIDRTLPQYLDAIDSDVYIFSGVEDLVPEFKKEGSVFLKDDNDEYIIRESLNGEYTIRYYKPRIEGLYARIERWLSSKDGHIKWRVITKDNISTLFGWTELSRITNPKHQSQIFEWLPEFVFDDKGNSIHYLYRREDNVGFNKTLLHNKNRYLNDEITYTNLYLDKILYGNKTPYKKFNDNFQIETDYMFQTVFDYKKDGEKDWNFREDAFSSYRSGFEIRTTRLCRKVLHYHCFDELSSAATLVKSLDLNYDTRQENFTFLVATTSTGYIRKEDNTYSSKSMPSMEFTYQEHEWSESIHTLSSENLKNAPVGFDESQYQFTDLYNEGLSGILSEQDNAWYYKHNLGNGHFEPAKKVTSRPSFSGVGQQLQFADLDADGRKQLVHSSEPRGYFELNDEDEWENFSYFDYRANINLNDSNTRMIDLNGDGKPDLIISEESAFIWYESLGKKGYAPAKKVSHELDEEQAPNVIFSDKTQSIFLADMSGDGLVDIVRIRNGEICYWSNLGYGRFGTKVNMDNAPWFDYSDAFNPDYIRISDIDGSGVPDIIYLGKSKFSCWKNLGGNGFSKTPFEITNFPHIDNHAKITITDLLGNGLGCIVWSSSLEKDAQAPLKYINLTNSEKPHIMKSYKNNLGKEVSFEYKPSTQYYIEDKLAGNPWISKLPFPVYCVSKTTSKDTVRGSSFVSLYSYHHGYYDHTEREFRGFGMVEQRDVESFEGELDQAPVITKSWSHIGKFINHNNILTQYAHEYWYEVMAKEGFDVTHNEIALDDAELIDSQNLTIQEWQEALRACKGVSLRSEIFSQEKEDRKKELTPYSVNTQNYKIRLLQPQGKNRHAVFALSELESLSYSYEREIEDPRIAHNLNIKHDEYGNVLESATVVYPRSVVDTLLPQQIRDKQNQTIITYVENCFTNDINSEDNYRLRVPSEVKTYELTGVVKSSQLFTVADFKNILLTETEVSYHITSESLEGSQKRVIEHVQTLYYKNDLSGHLPLCKLESKALPYENYQLAYTPELLSYIYDKKVDDTLMIEGKFANNLDNNWWIRSGKALFNADKFYLPISFTDPYGATTTVEYDDYILYIKTTTDALGHQSMVEEFNFYTLSPQKMKDLNDNISEVLFDELGLVKAMALKGKGDEADNLEGLNAFTQSDEKDLIKEFFDTSDDTLKEKANSLLQHATTRFVYDFNSTPVSVASIVREEHFKDNPHSALQIGFEYSDGMGEVIMKKIQSTPKDEKARWIGSGRTVLNNKGKAVKEYEPYFSPTAKYDSFEVMQEIGVTPIIYYDAMGRVLKTIMPNGTFSRVELDSWKQSSYDVNDTVLESSWYRERMVLDDNHKDKISAQKAAKHANTPTVEHFDTLGRGILSITHNRDKENNDIFISTYVELDSESNLLSVIDARGNVVMRYKYDMLGNLVYEDSMDKGKRWLLVNILGNPLRTWDERNHEFSYFYDILHRPIESKVKDNNGLNNIYEKIIYGEEKSKNLVGQVLKHYDTGGAVETPEYDFKAQALFTTRKLFKNYKLVADWTEENIEDDNSFENKTYLFTNKTDALGRVTKQITPDNRKITFEYSEAGTLRTQKVDGKVYIKNIEYNEKGQREKILYGNNVLTSYEYDKETFGLKHLLTLDNSKKLQDLHYTYDPVGNITHIEDKSDSNSFYNNEIIEPNASYTYDALYQLIEATGRENNIMPSHGSKDNWNDTLYKNSIAMRNYLQQYSYDEIGNVTKMQHSATGGDWRRNYEYEEHNNRLISTQVGGNRYLYSHHEEHGYIESMPHLQEMAWNFKEELVKTISQRRTDGSIAETTYYQYDGGGQRIRKITENQANAGETPSLKNQRIYIGNYEVYHENNNSERITLSLMDEEHRFVMIESQEDEKLIRYQLHNHLGSSSLELDDNAKLISYEEYHPFGTTAYQAVSKTIKSTAKRYRYTGMERDEESGFSYHSARYYLPWLGRWLSVDPIEDGVNVYAYVGNSPINSLDTTGENSESIISSIKNGDEIGYDKLNLSPISTALTTIDLLKNAYVKAAENEKTMYRNSLKELKMEYDLSYEKLKTETSVSKAKLNTNLNSSLNQLNNNKYDKAIHRQYLLRKNYAVQTKKLANKYVQKLDKITANFTNKLAKIKLPSKFYKLVPSTSKIAPGVSKLALFGAVVSTITMVQKIWNDAEKLTRGEISGTEYAKRATWNIASTVVGIAIPFFGEISTGISSVVKNEFNDFVKSLPTKTRRDMDTTIKVFSGSGSLDQIEYIMKKFAGY
ncbi:MAG: SpvB/TcaC N-terminal domain-containing protein [Sulfurimonas sp.]